MLSWNNMPYKHKTVQNGSDPRPLIYCPQLKLVYKISGLIFNWSRNCPTSKVEIFGHRVFKRRGIQTSKSGKSQFKCLSTEHL